MSSTASATPESSSDQAAPASAAARAALIELALVPGLRGPALRRLCERQGSLEAVLAQPWRRLAEGEGRGLARALAAGPDPERQARASAWLGEPGNHALTLLDSDYPAGLRDLADPPPVLWLKGDASLLQHPALAVVGSRRATPQGLLDARAFARHLGEAGLTIVSGLAEGIDGAAHEGALGTTGRTMAVLGHGLDRIYPPVHRKLAHRIALEGLLVSEYPLGTAALPAHFPERNRLISGLALGVLVIEAALGSGSLITARQGLEQGREVMALPGSIHAPLAKGCHQLIREGAALVESVPDVWSQLAVPLGRFRPLAGPRAGPETVAEDPDPVLRMLQAGPANVDQIALAIGLTAARVSSILGREEVTGRVARLHDGRYQRLSAGPG